MIRLINDQIKDEKLQYDINREAAKISPYHQAKFIYKCVTGEDIWPYNQEQIIEQAKFTYSPLGKAFEKQIKTLEDQEEKQVKVLDILKSNDQLTIEEVISKNALNNDEAKKELDKVKGIEAAVDRENLVYRATEYTYIFKNIRTRRTFGRDIYWGKITLNEADEDQSNLLNNIRNFRDETRTQNDNKKQEK